MTTTFTLVGFNPAEFMNKAVVPEAAVQKTRFDVVNPGKVMHANNAGGVVRVLQRGEIYSKDGNPYEGDCGKPCWWDRHPVVGMAMGIPVRVVRNGGGLKTYCDGIFCSYSCALAYLLKELSQVPSQRDPNYSQSKTILLQLFREEFPGEKLVKALDWKLLKDVGNGNLSYQEWAHGLKGIRIVQHPNLIFLPVTVTYDIINSKVP